MTATFHFHGDLPHLLRGKWKGALSVTIPVDRKASIKDMIESFGLPHTEVGSIELEGNQVDFTHIVGSGEVYSVEPVPVPWDVTRPSVLRPTPLAGFSFIVDVNVGRLARYLRAAGFDTLYDPAWSDRLLAELVRKQPERILLTRDLRLLMRKQVVFGRYIRADRPVQQLQEVVELFGLEGRLAPFTRCLECNMLLQPVAKEEILHRLEPLTRRYYSSFSRCVECDRIYWQGSHIERMRKLFPDQFAS